MNPSQLISETMEKADEALRGQLAETHGVFVTRQHNGSPFIIGYFHDKKSAQSLIKHYYGMSSYDAEKHMGVTITPMHRIKPGLLHAVVYDGKGYGDAMTEATDPTTHKSGFYKPGFGNIVNIIDGHPFVHWNAHGGLWYDESGIEASGGPGFRVTMSDLHLIGFKELTMKRWAEYPQADGAGHFKMTVPLWRWKPTTKPE